MIIDSPGLYELTTDLTDRPESVCIDIRASDVTFDGNKHVIDSDGSPSQAAILARPSSGLTGVTVRDVTVTDWDHGVSYRDISDGEITRTVVTNNTIGVAVWNSTAITVAGVDGTQSGTLPCTLCYTGGTVEVKDSTDSTVRNVSSEPQQVSAYGVGVVGSSNVSARDIHYDAGGPQGVVVRGSTDIRLDNVVVRGSPYAFAGIGIADATGVVLRDAVVNETGGPGIRVGDTADSRLINVTTRDAGGAALDGETGTTNLTVREFRLGDATTPTVVGAIGRNFSLSPVPLPPGDPAGQRNLSRYVEVSGTDPDVVVNVSYRLTDLVAANVSESTVEPWRHDGTWSQAVGTAGTVPGSNYVYATVDASGSPTVVIAPLGEADSGPPTGGGAPGFGVLVALGALLAYAIGLRRVT